MYSNISSLYLRTGKGAYFRMYLSFLVCLFLNFCSDMALAGKISTEIGVHSSAAKWFNLFGREIHHVQNINERVHQTKLHQGDDWHHPDSIKHWTYTVDGKVITCMESIEAIDEENKTIIYKVVGGDVSEQFKNFKFIFQTFDKNEGGAIVKWTIEYERINDDVEPPYGYIEFFHKSTNDIDNNLLKA